MASNYDIAFGLGRRYGRTLFKQDGIYYTGTNVIIRMFDNGKLVVLPLSVNPTWPLYTCSELLVALFKQKSL
ncbi:hypothetical protein L2475_02190 [Lactobacillus gasseri]|nr:hypothetical protein [Lactobacillus gasseri]